MCGWENEFTVYTYLGDIIVMTLHVLEAEILGFSDIPILQLVAVEMLSLDSRELLC